ncbi:pyridoxamine 5'-phosphate oxidase family protein [Actinoplanes sp. NPDC023801]|uniref:pyridoxamine 5'-phosphate oxidase family protein n=1 Tax=Actinoplanes sp. NPDC023801 TaxID=3154595 RepID=UPI0033C15524
MSDVVRSRAQRKADTLARLAAPVLDAWVATDGPHLVPLTLGWFQERLVVATGRDTPTAKSLIATGRTRIGLGSTRDVVMIDAVLDRWLPVAGAPGIGEAYAAQNDWDPRTAGPSYVFLILRMERVQAWREEVEIAGRTLMRDGVWLD